MQIAIQAHKNGNKTVISVKNAIVGVCVHYLIFWLFFYHFSFIHSDMTIKITFFIYFHASILVAFGFILSKV